MWNTIVKPSDVVDFLEYTTNSNHLFNASVCLMLMLLYWRMTFLGWDYSTRLKNKYHIGMALYFSTIGFLESVTRWYKMHELPYPPILPISYRLSLLILFIIQIIYIIDWIREHRKRFKNLNVYL